MSFKSYMHEFWISSVVSHQTAGIDSGPASGKLEIKGKLFPTITFDLFHFSIMEAK